MLTDTLPFRSPLKCLLEPGGGAVRGGIHIFGHIVEIGLCALVDPGELFLARQSRVHGLRVVGKHAAVAMHQQRGQSI